MTLHYGILPKKVVDAINAVTGSDASTAATVSTHTSQIAALQGKFVSAPGSAGASGVAGSFSYDATHVYVCVATNTWVRATLATW